MIIHLQVAAGNEDDKSNGTIKAAGLDLGNASANASANGNGVALGVGNGNGNGRKRSGARRR